MLTHAGGPGTGSGSSNTQVSRQPLTLRLLSAGRSELGRRANPQVDLNRTDQEELTAPESHHLLAPAGTASLAWG